MVPGQRYDLWPGIVFKKNRMKAKVEWSGVQRSDQGFVMFV